jgi:hypothetical protein
LPRAGFSELFEGPAPASPLCWITVTKSRPGSDDGVLVHVAYWYFQVDTFTYPLARVTARH